MKRLISKIKSLFARKSPEVPQSAYVEGREVAGAIKPLAVFTV